MKKYLEITRFKLALCKVRLFKIVLLSLLTTNLMAEQVIETEQYLIHYNAFNSTAIDADAATKNQLVRSKFNAMLNIAVLKKNADGTTTPVRSINTGTVENLLGQQQSLKFATIAEGKAIYYIASFRFANEEQMNFNVQVQPNPNQAAIKLALSQKFY
ncbi:MAG: hypothetical protein ACI9ES_003285, partial [Oceanospirillaceae bacterium]